MSTINNPLAEKGDDAPTATETAIIADWKKGAEYQSEKKGNGRYVIGNPAGTFNEKPRNARQFGKNAHRSDWIADIVEIGDMLLLGASIRGPMHYGLGTVRQDSYAIGSESSTDDCKWIIAAIADGVSSASQAHIFADYMARQAVAIIGEELNSSLFKALHNEKFWKMVSERLVEVSHEFCRKAAKRIVSDDKADDIDNARPKDFIQKWATTLEFVVIDVSGVESKADTAATKKEFVHVTVAGDGAAYILDSEQGWRKVKTGKRQLGNLVSNAVLSLPLVPEEFHVSFGFLEGNENFILTTDGLGDFIGDGDTPLGGFLQSELPTCESLAEFMQIADVSLYQADDDRTIIMIKGKMQ